MPRRHPQAGAGLTNRHLHAAVPTNTNLPRVERHARPGDLPLRHIISATCTLYHLPVHCCWSQLRCSRSTCSLDRGLHGAALGR